MTTAARLALFAAVLVVAFAASFGVGAAVGPVDEDDPAPPPTTAPVEQPGTPDHGEHP